MTQEQSAAPRPAGRGEAKPPPPPPLSPQEQAAIARARDDKSVYPRRWRKKDLQYTVVNGDPQPDGNMLVTVTYRPSGSFRGRPGEERILVAPSGDIVQRRQIHAPSENFPWLLATIALASVIAAPILMWLILTSDERNIDQLYVAGRVLWMRVEEPELTRAVQYTSPDINGVRRNWQISPQNPENMLATIKVTLINQRTSRAVVVIDENAAVLISDRGFNYSPVNVVTESKLVSDEQVNRSLVKDGFIGLWRTIPISAGENLAGWMVFEVPPGTAFREFRWEASDQLIARF